MQDLAAKRYIGSSTGENTQVSLLQPFKMDMLKHIDRENMNLYT